MTHKYQWAEDMVSEMIPEFGTSIIIETPQTTITGQQDPEVFQKYETSAVITENLLGRNDRYQRADRAKVLLPTTVHRRPKPGDVFTLPNGKRYTAEMVSTMKPAGVNVAYEVYLSDG